MTSRRLLVVLPTLLSLLLLAPLSANAGPTTFTDTAGTAHEEAVAALVDASIAQGCGPDRFCPGDELTRGQLSTMLFRALDLPAAAGGEFTDTADSGHAEAIDSLADAGLIVGCGDEAFCPGEPITRAQLATMIDRAFDVPAAPADVTYFDDVRGVHRPAVRAVAAAGITAGCTDRLTSFCASDGVRRAQAATFLARTLDLVDRVEITAFADRKEAQDAIDAEVEARQAAADEKRRREAAEVETPAEVAVDVALAQVGKPYRWGGSGPSSFDCSGLTSFAWAKSGTDIPRTSRAQYAGTTRISRDELRPGDLVFYHSPISHVAMYIGDGRVVEAPNAGNDVRIREDGLTRSGVVGFGRP